MSFHSLKLVFAICRFKGVSSGYCWKQFSWCCWMWYHSLKSSNYIQSFWRVSSGYHNRLVDVVECDSIPWNHRTVFNHFIHVGSPSPVVIDNSQVDVECDSIPWNHQTVSNHFEGSPAMISNWCCWMWFQVPYNSYTWTQSFK